MNAVLQIRDERRFPAPGQLIELADGRQLHLHVSGSPSTDSGPTVILDAGHGAFSAVFSHLQRELSGQASVVSYDRPGYGWSDPADPDRPPSMVAEDLREALTLAGIDGPFVLVGHSLGGLHARHFTARFPDEVTGLALIDPAHHDPLDRLPEDFNAQMRQLEQAEGPLVLAAHLGIMRLMDLGADTTDGLPQAAADPLRSASVTPGYLRAYINEARSFDRLAEGVPALPADLPAIIINASAAQPGWETARPVLDAMNRELVETSKGAWHRDHPGANHTTILTDPEQAAQVAADILDVVSR